MRIKHKLPPSLVGFNTPGVTGCRRDGEAPEECHKMAGLVRQEAARAGLGR
jgi:hypothetical protein